MSLNRRLFELKPEFQIAQIGPSDALGLTPHWATLRRLVLANEAMYPGIGDWWTRRVAPGLLSGERIGWVGYEGNQAIASAILRKGSASKFCHLRINEDFQDLSLGEVFFSLMALNVRHLAEEIHFTLPESLWLRKSDFFRSFGFGVAFASETQYRKGETELKCSAPLRRVWARVVEKLPQLRHKFSLGGYGSNLLMSVKPEFAERIFSGDKRIEIRRAAMATKWVGQRVAIYATRPICALVGEATIQSVERGVPAQFWEKYQSELGCNKEQFDQYTAQSVSITAIRLQEVRSYREAVPMTQIAQLLGNQPRPPESTCSLSNNKAWAQAVSVANLLHGNFAKSQATAAASQEHF